jgi:hypothetical protein
VGLLKRARDVIVVGGTEGRNPFEVLMLVWSFLVGLLLLASGAFAPDTVEALLDAWMVTGWYIFLCVGGLVGLVGVWLRSPILSLGVERGGMFVLAPAGLIYAVALFLFGGAQGVYQALAVLAFAASAFWRAVRITNQIARMRKQLQALSDAADKT